MPVKLGEAACAALAFHGVHGIQSCEKTPVIFIESTLPQITRFRVLWMDPGCCHCVIDVAVMERTVVPLGLQTENHLEILYSALCVVGNGWIVK